MSINKKHFHPNFYFCPKKDWLEIQTIDLHTCGQPLRVITNGLPKLKGNNVLAFRKDFQTRWDHYRKILMHEPRGHKDMYGCALTPPNDSKATFGVVFFHNQGYSTMCGHAMIALTTLAYQLHWIANKNQNTLFIDAPCGRIKNWPMMESDELVGAGFLGVPSFTLKLDGELDIPELGKITFDIAYGGAFYAYVDLTKNALNIDLETTKIQEISHLGMKIKNAIMASSIEIKHPFVEDLSFLYGTIFYAPSKNPAIDSKNVCVFANGQIDRSPTGSGLMGRLALLNKRNEIQKNQAIRVQSPLGTTFIGMIVKEQEYGPYQGIIPSISGSAYITGKHTFWVHPKDMFPNGFELGETI
ncbi:MAG: proline racemase family protein [Flavobacteriaceae bacterium]|nr:proline racemase family protein [Flavobacteriaceae bacterium]